MYEDVVNNVLDYCYCPLGDFAEFLKNGDHAIYF